MNRKDKTIKQLQAECKKRKVGYMMNWTKAALTKRLEDEDTRELDIKNIEDRASKEIDKAKKELKAIKTQHDENLIKLEKLDPMLIEEQIKAQMLVSQKSKLNSLKKKFDKLHTEQQELKAKILSIGDEKLILIKEMAPLKT